MFDLLFDLLVLGFLSGGAYIIFRMGVAHERFEQIQRQRVREILEAEERAARIARIHRIDSLQRLEKVRE